MATKRILFVCTGNSCRSVMAQEYLRHLLRRAGLERVQVDSAGVFAVSGMSPTRETLRVLQDNGVAGSDHRARLLAPSMVQEADLVFVMEQFQRDEVLRRDPSSNAKTYLLKTYGLSAAEAQANANIPDPIGKPLEVYEVCFADIREAVERVAKSLGVHSA